MLNKQTASKAFRGRETVKTLATIKPGNVATRQIVKYLATLHLLVQLANKRVRTNIQRIQPAQQLHHIDTPSPCLHLGNIRLRHTQPPRQFFLIDIAGHASLPEQRQKQRINRMVQAAGHGT